MLALALLLAFLLANLASASPPTQTLAQTINGNTYLAQTLSSLDLHASIVAKIRHESRLQNQTLSGSGNYWQQRTRNDRITRWEMKTQIADQTASFLQVYDGNYLWTDHRLPSKREVRRLDVAWLQAKLRTHHKISNIDRREQALQTAMGQGGLRQMLSDLLRNFDFHPPKATQLNGLSVNALIGHWRPERLAQLWPDSAQQANAPSLEWPEQIPHHVLLLVGRKDNFPYVCEHRTAADAQLATSLAGFRPTNEPLLRYEIYEVQFAVKIPPELFDFNPGDIALIDESALIFEQLTKTNSTP